MKRERTSPGQLLDLFTHDGDGDECLVGADADESQEPYFQDLKARGLIDEIYNKDDDRPALYGLSASGKKYILGKIKFPKRATRPVPGQIERGK